LLDTKWARRAYGKAEKHVLDGKVPRQRLLPYLREQLEEQFVPLQHAMARAVQQACARADAGCCGGPAALIDEVYSRLGIFFLTPDRFDPTLGHTEEAYFFGVARKMVLKVVDDALRRTGGKAEVDVAVANPPSQDTVAQAVDNADTVAAMLAALDDDTERETFTALYIDELTPKEAAKRLKVGVFAIYKRREALAAKLQSRGFGPDGRRN
jgi:hypothetical protein